MHFWPFWKINFLMQFCTISSFIWLLQIAYHRSSHRRCSIKNVFLKISQNLQESTCVKISFLIKLHGNFIKRGTLAQVFSREFCEISENTFSYRTYLVVASVILLSYYEIMFKVNSRKKQDKICWLVARWSGGGFRWSK